MRGADYFLEETGKAVRINMYKHLLSRDLNYTHAVKYEVKVELAKGIRSAEAG